MNRFARSFSINYREGARQVEDRLVSDLKDAENDGRGYPLKMMRKRMCVGTIIDEISEGLSDAILKLDGKGILSKMDSIHKAEMMIELIKHEIAQQRIVDAMFDKAKSANRPVDPVLTDPTVNSYAESPEGEARQEPEPPVTTGIIPRQAPVAEYNGSEPEPVKKKPKVRRTANIFA
ncbi:hypothetical protein [Bacterioplanoides sp.]|uniref:hypothetical protein n=1 Tax=Bacterioplanoides sp. TaxID=2066072 RepID=UPI003B5C817A